MTPRSTRAAVRLVRAAAGAALLALGCAGALEYPIAADVQWSQQQGSAVTIEDLTTGRSVYVQKCAGCHNLYRPAKYTPARWPDLVAKMSKRSKLAGEEQRLIASYLSATSARLREPVSVTAGAASP